METDFTESRFYHRKEIEDLQDTGYGDEYLDEKYAEIDRYIEKNNLNE
jgi:outer membrane translocation and assembly module TamA